MKIVVGVTGIVILVISLLSFYSLYQSEYLASMLYDKKTAFGIIQGPPQCAWQVKPPEKVISENKSQAIIVETKNTARTECASTISIRAPGFDTSPTDDEQEITHPVKGKGSLSWILTPRKTGTFDIAISDVLNTDIFGITVTNLFGLSTTQAKLFSIFGTLFGPMLTVPWWWDRFRQRKPTPSKIET